MNIALIADSKQAGAFIKSGLAVDAAFSLCPSASYQLQKAGINVESSAQYYGSLSHARTALITARQLEPITGCGASAYNLAPGEISGFRANLLYIISTLYYFYYATRHLRRAQATFQFGGNSYASYETVFSALLDYTLRRYNHAYENTAYSPLHYRIARLCNTLLWKTSGAKNATRAVHFGSSALVQIEQALLKETKKLIVFRPRAIGKNIAQTLMVTGAALLHRNIHLPYFRHTPPADYHRDFSAETIIFAERVQALSLTFPLPVFLTRIISDSGWYMPFLMAQYNAGEHLTNDLAPQLIMTNKGKYHFIRSAIAHLPKNAVGMLINHGTHTAQAPGTISQVAANLWASDDRICLYNASVVTPRLPLTQTQVEELYAAHLPQFIRLPTVKKITRIHGDPAQHFKIVFAGNYIGPASHIPWCTETAEEYLLNLLELIKKIGPMPRVEFIIKLKARKASTHIAILQERIDALGLGKKVRIDTETKFLDVLKDTHLVISNLSTTIEEALSNRVPVLLHTYRKHYFHLPSAFEAPGGYVYGVKPGQDLGALLEAIRMNYQPIVASDAGLNGIVWQEGQYNNLQEFASKITSLAA